MTIRKPTPRKPALKRKAKLPPEPESLFERLAKIGDAIPDEELAKHPSDGARNLEHYLYGKPRLP